MATINITPSIVAAAVDPSYLRGFYCVSGVADTSNLHNIPDTTLDTLYDLQFNLQKRTGYFTSKINKTKYTQTDHYGSQPCIEWKISLISGNDFYVPVWDGLEYTTKEYLHSFEVSTSITSSGLKESVTNVTTPDVVIDEAMICDYLTLYSSKGFTALIYTTEEIDTGDIIVEATVSSGKKENVSLVATKSAIYNIAGYINFPEGISHVGSTIFYKEEDEE